MLAVHVTALYPEPTFDPFSLLKKPLYAKIGRPKLHIYVQRERDRVKATMYELLTVKLVNKICSQRIGDKCVKIWLRLSFSRFLMFVNYFSYPLFSKVLFEYHSASDI